MRPFDSDRWTEIWQTLSRNRRRSILTALGVFWGIFMLTVLLGAGTGMGRLFRMQLGEMSVNTLMIQPVLTSLPYKGMPMNRWWGMDNADVEAVAALPEVLHASGVFWGGQVHCSREGRKGDYGLIGYMPDMQRINPEKIACGRFINEVDMAQKRKVCVVGNQVVKDLLPGVEDPTGMMIRVNNSYFTIVGVMLRQSQIMTFSDVERTIVTPISLAQQLYGAGNRIDMLSVAGRDDLPSKLVEQACRKTLFARHMIDPNDEKAVWCMSMADVFEKLRGLFRGITLLTWIVGLGSLLAGIVGVSNIMLVTVKERTQEIGIRRALGAPPRAILAQILSEGFVLTFIAGIAGLTAGVGLLSVADALYARLVASGIQIAEGVSWQIGFSTGMLSLAIVVAGSLLSGLIPAGRALRIKAVDAIREE